MQRDDAEPALEHGSLNVALARAIFEHSSDGIVVVDANGVIQVASARAESMLGYAPGAAIGLAAFDLVHPEEQVTALEGFQSTLGSPDSRPIPVLLRLRCGDGTWLQTEVIATNHLQHEAIRGLLLSIRDVSTSMRTDAALRRSEERHRLIVELSREGIWMVDAAGDTTFANRALATMLDTTEQDLLGSSIFEFVQSVGGDADPPPERHWMRTAREHDIPLVTRRGRIVWTRMNTSPIVEHSGVYRGAIALVTDVTERRTLELGLALAARRDPLTGVANRIELFETLEEMLVGDRLVTLLYVDLDGFKQVNDVYGHAIGDDVLRAAAARLCGAVRSSDTVARMGGDEFVIASDGLNGPADALELGRRICDAIARPFSVDTRNVQIGASVGTASAYRGDVDALLTAADEALYRAKRTSRGTVELGESVAVNR